MFKLDLQSRIPIYEQLKGKISELILVGIIQPDDQLPSVRALARDLGVNPNTVQKAYQDLERDGVIYSISGRGSFIAEGSSSKGKLETQYIDKLKSVITEVKQNGIEFERVIDTVKLVYEGATA